MQKYLNFKKLSDRVVYYKNAMQFILYAHKKRQDLLDETADKRSINISSPFSGTN